ncbi:MAG: response regulator [Pseudomonas sp.]|uniref:response regulator n=1 Tax=Pseudomonas sp. TaxID=306 RepID=UPI00121BD3DB|nr:response regulator [Pseudomonas sp.]RZI72372.1 MAG: response regulator [Pseudomonas sp.]
MSALNGQKVLVVEDETITGLMLEQILAEAGAKVIGPATTVQQALDLLKTHTPAVATLDFNLGGELSTEVANALDAMHVPFLLASAYSGLSHMDLPAAAGVVGKPYSPESFIAAVIAVLAKRKD